MFEPDLVRVLFAWLCAFIVAHGIDRSLVSSADPTIQPTRLTYRHLITLHVEQQWAFSNSFYTRKILHFAANETIIWKMESRENVINYSLHFAISFTQSLSEAQTRIIRAETYWQICSWKFKSLYDFIMLEIC